MKTQQNGHSTEADVLEVKKPSKKEKTPSVSPDQIVLPELDFRQVTFKIVGTTPLIVSNFGVKARRMMLEKQMKKATKGREAKNPTEQYEASKYPFPDGKRTGFPAVGFKASMTRAGKLLGMPMTDTRGRFHVLSEPDGAGLIQIKGKESMREDVVRLATGVADIRFRACYEVGWSAEILIQYNATWISQEQLAQILKVAGFSCGIGEWRPEKSNSGQFGLWNVK